MSFFLSEMSSEQCAVRSTCVLCNTNKNDQ